MMDDNKLALIRSRISVLEAGARLCFVSARVMHHQPVESSEPRKGKARPGSRKSRQVPTDDFTLEMFEGGMIEGPAAVMSKAADQINAELAQWAGERHDAALRRARQLVSEETGLEALKSAQESVHEAQAYAAFKFVVSPGMGEGRMIIHPYQRRITLYLRGCEDARVDLTNHLNAIVARAVSPILEALRNEIVGMLNEGPAHDPP
jgi:hypothetical protein